MRRRGLAAAAAVAVLLPVLVAGGAGSALAEVVLRDPVAFAADPARDVSALADDNGAARGVWSDGATMWVADGAAARLFAYSVASGGRVEGRDIASLHDAGNRSPRAVWSDCSTMWVSDAAGRRVHAYTLDSGQPAAGGGFDTVAVDGRGPVGLWSNGTTAWVAYWATAALYAYDLASGERDPDSDIDALSGAGNDSPTGLWSDGATMWVADWRDDKIYAYDLNSGTRETALEFDTLSAAGANSPRGIWSNGAMMWVSDDADDTVRAFNMPATDAAAGALRSLDVSGVDLGFDPDTLSYEVTVADTVETVTVSTSSLLGCDLAPVSPADADPDTAGHQVSLAVGDNTITVLSTTGAVTTTYTVTVTRRPAASQSNQLNGDPADNQDCDPENDDNCGDEGVPARDAFVRDADAEFALDAANSEARAMWSDGVTAWVSDLSGRLFAYTLDSGARDADSDVTALAAAGNRHPNGMWANGTTVWVADRRDMNVYAYTLDGGDRDLGSEFALHADNAHAKGIWADGTTAWVADWDDDKLFAYTLDGGARQTDADIDLHADNGHPAGIWANGTTVWVLDDSADRVYAYTLDSGDRQTDLEFDTLAAAGNSDPKGIWSNGTTMWVTDKTDDHVYAYNMPPDPQNGPEDGESCDPENDDNCEGEDGEDCDPENSEDCDAEDGEDCEGESCDDTDPEDCDPETDANCEDGEDCDGEDGEGEDGEDGEGEDGGDCEGGFWLAGENYRPRALWSDGATLWVGDLSGRLFAYALAGGARAQGRDISLAAGSDHPGGVWSDGVTVWVADSADSHVHAYDLATGAHAANSGFALFADNAHPKGAWSDGVTLWVADWQDDKIYAYSLDGGARSEGRDIALEAGNGHPSGMWSDGVTLWVADYVAAKVFAYDLASGARRAGSDLDGLDAANAEPKGIWSDGVTMWVSDRSSASSREDRRRMFAYPMPPNALSPAPTPDNGDEDCDAETDEDCEDGEPGEDSTGLALGAGSGRPWGMVGDTDAGLVWVHDAGDGGLYAYRLADGQRAEGSDSAVAGDAALRPDAGRGVCFDGTTLWQHTLVAEPAGSPYSGSRTLRAFSGFDTASPPASLARDAARDVDLLDLWFARALRDKPPGVHSTGVWCDSSLLLTLFSGDEQFFARVDLDSDNDGDNAGTVVPVDLGGAARRPADLWSDADTVWILHHGPDGSDPRINAYGAADGTPRPGLDIDLSGLAGLWEATSVWSDGDTMHIAGTHTDRSARMWSAPMPDPHAGPPRPWSAWENLGNQIWVRFSEPLAAAGAPGSYRVTATRYSTSPRDATLTPTRVRIDPDADDTLHITLPGSANLRAGDDIKIAYHGTATSHTGLRGSGDGNGVAPFAGFDAAKRAKPSYARLASLRDRITVTWSQYPSHNEFDAHNTYIEYRPAGTAEWTRAIDPAGNADRSRIIDGAEIGGFAPSTAYDVRIAAANTTAPAWRHPHTTITLPAFPEPPKTPTDVTAAPGPGIGQITLTWNAPPDADPRDPPQRYHIGYDCLNGGPGHDSGDRTGTRTTPASTTSFTLADLPGWARCSLNVAAENYTGTGPTAHPGTHGQRYTPKRRPPVVRVIRTPDQPQQRALPQRSTENACLAEGADFLHTWSTRITMQLTTFPVELVGYRTGVMGSVRNSTVELGDFTATLDSLYTVPASGDVVLAFTNVSQTLRPDLAAVLRADTVFTIGDHRYPLADAAVRSLTQSGTDYTIYTWTGANTTPFANNNRPDVTFASTLCVRGLDFAFGANRVQIGFTVGVDTPYHSCYDPGGLAMPQWHTAYSATRSVYISNTCGQQIDSFIHDPHSDRLRLSVLDDRGVLVPRALHTGSSFSGEIDSNGGMDSGIDRACSNEELSPILCRETPTGMVAVGSVLYVANQDSGSIIVTELSPFSATVRLRPREEYRLRELPLYPTGLETQRLAPRGLAYDGEHLWILDERNDLVFKRTTTNGSGGRSGFVSSPLDGCHNPWDPPFSPTRGCNFESDLERKRAMGVRDLLSAGEPGTTREYSGALWVDTDAELVYVGIYEAASYSLHDRGFLAAFDSVDGTRMSDYDIPLHRNNQKPAGVWMDDNEMWVLDDGPANPRMYIYQR